MSNYKDPAYKAAFSNKPEVKKLSAAINAILDEPNADLKTWPDRLKALSDEFPLALIKDYCRFRMRGNANIAKALGLDPAELHGEVRTVPLNAGSQRAPAGKAAASSTERQREAAKQATVKKAKSERAWRYGDFSTKRQTMRIAVWLHWRDYTLTWPEVEILKPIAEFARAEYLNPDDKKRRLTPSPEVAAKIGEAQLAPPVIDWLIQYAYELDPKNDAELVDDAKFTCACAVLKRRYVYLPDSGEAYRVEDRTAVSESSAVGDMQAWFGAGVGEHVIRRVLRAECPKAKGKVRLPGRDVRFLHHGRWVVNEWTPPPWPEVNAKDEDVKPFTDLVRYQCEAEAEVVFDWMAAQVQTEHWHKHQRWGLILISDHQQTGREAMLNIFSRAAGLPNRTNGMLAELEKGPETAAYLARGSFVVFSEAHVGFHQLERLKEVMGSERALVRTMNRNAQYMDHASTIAILSNDPQCVKLSADNQRFFVIRNTKPRMDHKADGTKKLPGEPGFDFYDRLKTWEDNGGPAKLLSWLRRRDLSNHNFETRPYATAAELELIDSALSPVITDIKAMAAARKGPFAAELVEIAEARREIETGVDMPGGQRFQKLVADYEVRDALKAAGAVALGQARVRTVISKPAKPGEKKEEVLDRERVSLWALAHAPEWKALKDGDAPDIRGWGLLCPSFDLARAKAEERARQAAEAAGNGENVVPFNHPEPSTRPPPEPGGAAKRPWKPRF